MNIPLLGYLILLYSNHFSEDGFTLSYNDIWEKSYTLCYPEISNMKMSHTDSSGKGMITKYLGIIIDQNFK